MAARRKPVATYGMPMNRTSATSSPPTMNAEVPPVFSCCSSSASCTSAERMSIRIPYRSDSQSTRTPRTNGARATFEVSIGESSASRYR
jgi:hypothetical protein